MGILCSMKDINGEQSWMHYIFMDLPRICCMLFRIHALKMEIRFFKGTVELNKFLNQYNIF